MKNIFRFVSTIAITIILLTLHNANIYGLETNIFNNDIQCYQNTKQDMDEVTHLQSKAQVEFFMQALDELGATSPEQVMKLWIKAEQTRNGVFQYAVACDELKNKIIKKWGLPQENFWIIGGSSPWLDYYEIISNKKLNDSTYKVKIKYYWITSAGPSASTENTLIIVKNKDNWCVKEVK